VAWGVALNHPPAVGCLAHKGHEDLASGVGNAAQVDQAATCENMWSGISAALSAPWNPTAAAVPTSPAAAAPPAAPPAGSPRPDEPPLGAADKLTPKVSWPGGASLGLLVLRMTNSSICHVAWLVDSNPPPH